MGTYIKIFVWYYVPICDKIINIGGGENMAKSQTTATNKYKAKAYDRIELIVPKGRKAELQNYLESRASSEEKKESVNGFINRFINETLERELQKNV